MKKTLLFTLALSAVGMIHADPMTVHKLKGAEATTSVRQAEAEEGTIKYGFAGASAASDGLSKAIQSAVALELSGEYLEMYAGCEITQIIFEHGYVFDTTLENFQAFVTTDLYTDPEITVDVPIRKYNDFDVIVVDLPEPFLIPDSGKVFVGYGMTPNKKGDYPYAFDFQPTSHSLSDWLGYVENGQWIWKNQGKDVGSYCIWAMIKGNTLPKNDLALTNMEMPFTSEPGRQMLVQLSLENMGSNDVNSFTLETTVGDGEPMYTPINLSEPCVSRGQISVKVARTCDQVGNNIPVTVKVIDVNGEDDPNPNDNSITNYLLCLEPGTGYDRSVVIEEYTGTWCGYCPRGWDGMEYMKEKYADDPALILIAVHKTDRMEIEDYKDEISRVQAKWPSAMINRRYMTDPERTYLEKAFTAEKNYKAFAKVTLEGSYDENTRTVALKSGTKFLADDASNYRIAYVMTLDGMGPYVQQNYFCNPGEPACYGFENMPREVELMFNDVSRCLNTFQLLETPGVEADVEYTHTHTISIPENVDIKNCHFTAMLINDFNDTVENAAYLKELPGLSKVETVEGICTDAPVYYNMQGVRIQNPQPGVPCIKVEGSKATKMTR